MINKILNRTSVREYTNQKLPNEIKKNLIDAINSSPTSVNGSSFSAIIIEDKNILNGLLEQTKFNNRTQNSIVESSMCVIFCADLNRMKYASEVNNTSPCFDSLELINVAIGDAYIAATTLMHAAISYDLGTCFLGSIKIAHEFLKKELNLKGYIIPIIGMVLGYPKIKNEIKPKLNKVYVDKYDLNLVKKEIDNYDLVMEEYLKNRNLNSRNSNWTKSIANVYTNYELLDKIVSNFNSFPKIRDVKK